MVWRDGVHVAGSVLWCDAGRARDLCFVSHAHVAARGAHGKVLATDRTLALLGKRSATTLASPFGRRFSLGSLRLELFPSGHLPGAASLRVEVGGRTVVYGGDVNPRPGLAEPMEVRDGDALVLESPLAPLDGELPPRAEAEAALCDAVGRALADGATPVVLAPALGAAQDALAILHRAGVPLRAHPRVLDGAFAWQRAGITMPPVRRGMPSRGEALVWPLHLRASAQLGRLPRPRLIAATGLALDPLAARKLDVAEVVPLSDHADRPSLLAYVAHTGAREVWLTDGWCEPLARALAARGVRAAPLGPPRQMDLFA